MNPAEIFNGNLALIDRIADRVCRRARVYGPDAEDFASQVKLRLMENDYAVLRKWEERSSLATFLAIVIQRLFIDERRAQGRWVSSAEARRLGPAATLLEMILVRDRRTMAEAVTAVTAVDKTLSAADVERLAAQLPDRAPRARSVPMDEDAEETFVASQTADERARAAEAERLSSHASRVVRQALDAMPLEDRMLLRFRFLKSMTIADIARMMDVPQRPLYRRLEGLLSTLRRKLAAAGLNADALAEVIGTPAETMDFGWKSTEPMTSTLNEWHETSGGQAP